MIPSISNPVLGFSLIVILGYLGGLLAKKIHLPSIIGNLCIGFLLGPFGLGIFSFDLIEDKFSPIGSIAFGFIAVSIALHLKKKEFKKVIVLSFFDILFTFSIIFLSFLYFTSSPYLSVLLGITGATTAPAASLAVVRESRAKGPLVSALLPTIALNNVLCIVLFTFILGILGILVRANSLSLFSLLKQMLFASSLGVVFGYLFCLSAPFVKRIGVKTIWASFFALLILVGVAEQLHLSVLLSSICMGFVIANSNKVADEVFGAFNKFESFVYLLFFTMAGTHLNPSFALQEGWFIALFVAARFLGKLSGGYVGACMARLPKSKLFGIGLLPQAGLALAFLLLLEEKGIFPSNLMDFYSTIVLSGIMLNEFSGSVGTKLLFKVTKEEGKAYPPVFGFITDKDVIIGLDAEDRWEAITKLVHQICLRKGIPSSEEGRLLESVIERELSMTTGIGKSLAIPHGVIEREDSKILGVFAISHKGIDFRSMDGLPVHFIILSLVPKDRLEDHLKYLAEVSRVFSKPFVSSALMEARTEQEVIKILLEAQQ